MKGVSFDIERCTKAVPFLAKTELDLGVELPHIKLC